jgi:PAS domain S-box-containing protein
MVGYTAGHKNPELIASGLEISPKAGQMNELWLSSKMPNSDLRHLLDAPPGFIELLPIAIYACDASGRVLWFNRLAAELWGRAPRVGDDAERFCGSYKLHFGGSQIGREETPMAHALATGQAVDGVEGIVERPDGSRVWAMVHIAPVKDDAGRVVGAINCFHDTTELHRIGDALVEKESELEDFFENGAVALHLVSGEGTILRANKAELDLLGYRPEEYIGRSIGEFHADADVLTDILERLAGGQKLQRHPARLKAKDGSIKHVVITSNANFQNGRFVNTRCFTEDVTAEVLAKETTAETEERFRQLLEALPAAVYTTVADGRITYYNRAAVELSGREPQLGSDKWCVTWRLYTPDGVPMAHDECPMAVALKENRPIRDAEALAERPDGTRVPFLPFPVPLRNRRGEVVAAVNMLVDISERKQAESHQLVLLKELNHRVKNNMQMLQSMLNSSLRETSAPEARAVLAEATQRVAAMAAAQRILYQEGAPTGFHARDFLESVCAAVEDAFGGGIAIVVEKVSGVLSNDTAMPLALILNELLTNAAKHGLNGSASATIRVGLDREDDGYSLWVQDDGPGFELSPAVLRRSSGLGLVSGLAAQIHGSLSVERERGARCILRFREPGAACEQEGGLAHVKDGEPDIVAKGATMARVRQRAATAFS